MNIHEYQAKDLMKKFGIKVLGGQVAHTVDEAVEAAKKLDSNVWVVKAQIHAGGRGKAGGVKVAKSLVLKSWGVKSQIQWMKLSRRQRIWTPRCGLLRPRYMREEEGRPAE